MGSAAQTPYFFTPKPLFGLDIGSASLKVIQLTTETRSGLPKLVGYGNTTFDPRAIEGGVVVEPEIIAKAAYAMFRGQMIGEITSRRVAIAIPAYHTFTRSMQLPALAPSERSDAVSLEAEQYLPMPLSEMYLDYTVLRETKDASEVLAVAVPKQTVDSCMQLAAVMGLEPVLVETTMNASGRMFSCDNQSDVPSLLIDLGSISSDISIYDNGIVTTGTVDGGGQDFTIAIEKALKVTAPEASIIKTKYGLGVSRRQAEIKTALEPTLQMIVKEIKRLLRYHTEHYSSDRPIQQVVLLGGGANIPGLSDYFIEQLRIAVRSCDPWQYVNYSAIQPPSSSDRPMYATAIGLALAPPHKVFA